MSGLLLKYLIYAGESQEGIIIMLEGLTGVIANRRSRLLSLEKVILVDTSQDYIYFFTFLLPFPD